jgi:integrase
MASISSQPNGRRTIQFIAADGKRKSIRLGKVSMKTAEEVCRRVEYLHAAKVSGTAADAETMKWLASTGAALHAKLAAAGLVAPRQTATTTLGQWLTEYREYRADVSEGTSTNYGIITNRLLAFFPADRLLHTITEADADRWLVYLKHEYAGPTVSKSVKVARQFWAQAIRHGLASSNPFAHLRTPSEVNTARAFFVDRPTFALVLAACPDDEWRLLLALARYGGLRTPSEPLVLEWSDVNWERERFRVVAPKTKHQDGGERWVPLFPELRPYLERAFELAAPGAVHVVTRWRDTDKNLRTGLLRILRRAGIKSWPRLYQNLRASRETELAEAFPIHVVAEWLGNSPKTALAHYTQVTEDYYRKALQNPVQQPVETTRALPQSDEGDWTEGEAVQEFATCCDSEREYLMTHPGSISAIRAIRAVILLWAAAPDEGHGAEPAALPYGNHCCESVHGELGVGPVLYSRPLLRSTRRQACS